MTCSAVISGLAGYVRGWRALFAAAACLYLLIIPAYLTLRSSRVEAVSTRARLTEMSGLRVEYMALKSEANGFERRLVLSKANGALQAMDDVASALGVKGKLKSVKAAGVREMKDRVLAERAEVKFEKLSMNELVNVFSRMEDYPMLLSINGISLKKSFDNPELLDLTMTVDLFTRR